MGFRKFWDFNQAILSKLAWWVLSGKDCLCIEVLRAKYKVHHNWLNQAPHSNAFPVWKSLIGTKHLLSEAACLLVGNGEPIRTWSDPWVLNLLGFIPSPKVGANPDLALIVSQLLNQDRSGWDIAKLRHFFEDSVVDIIMQVPLPSFPSADCWSWTLTNSGKFTIISTYWLGRISSPPLMMDLSQGQVWKSRLHEKLKMHLWRIATNVLPTKGVISQFAKVEVGCPLCNLSDESPLHIFALCPIAKSL